jgi:hypothetical protein
MGYHPWGWEGAQTLFLVVMRIFQVLKKNKKM